LAKPSYRGGWFKAAWTHEAHFAVLVYLLRCPPELDLEQEIAALWRASNEAMGIANTDTAGYHHTITLTYLHAVRALIQTPGWPVGLADCVNAVLAHPVSQRTFPLTLYPEAVLMSAEARLA
jgi:hypothetical protein